MNSKDESGSHPADVRVKFYGSRDLSSSFYLAKAVLIVDKISQSKQHYKINDVLEYHNILQYIQHGAYLTLWSKAEKTAFLDAEADLHRIVNSYFKSMNGNNFSRRIKQLDQQYIDDFLDLFVKLKLHQRISKRQFGYAVRSMPISVFILVANEQLVRIYPDIIKDIILSDVKNAEIILEKYLVKSNKNRDNIYLPSNITDTEKIQLIDKYIDSLEANLNYIRVICDSKSKDFRIPDDMRLKAIRKESSGLDKIFEKDTGLRVTYQIGISKKQTMEIVSEQLDHGVRISFAERWLKDNLDYATILNNFIYLFEYAYSNMLITLISTESSSGIVERFMGVKAKSDYPTNILFSTRDYISTMEMFVYYDFLQTNDVRLEDVIEWFFLTYVKEQFKIEDFKVAMPSKLSSYREKCSYIFPEMESMLKQFRLYVTKGEIDQELVRISTTQTAYNQLPSFNKKKYLYANKDNEDIRSMLFLMFSDQSGLTHINDNKQADNLYKLLLKYKLNYNELQHYQVASIDWLKSMTILKIEKGQVIVKNRARLALLSLLNQSEAISYHHLSDSLKKEADAMIKRGLLDTEDTLLSRPEVAYFNYHLNKKEFGNSLDLKNKYSHGTPPVADDGDASIYKEHYMIGLKLLIVLLIKINDDLCIHFDNS